MAIFGNRDSSYSSSPAAGASALPDDLAPPATSARAFGAIDNRRVILRVHGDENIVVGNAEGRENAVRIARELVQHIEQAATKGEWPQIDERFIRPGAIVSIDVQRSE
jgi:GGDEF domain-containing protein